MPSGKLDSDCRIIRLTYNAGNCKEVELVWSARGYLSRAGRFMIRRESLRLGWFAKNNRFNCQRIPRQQAGIQS